MKMDLHIHSVFSSDGRERPEDILRYARKIGLDGIAILDHNDVRGSLKAYEMSKGMEDFLVVRGLEVSTDAGHIIAYGVDKSVPSRKTIEETVEMVQDFGGISVVPHPYRFWSGIGAKSVSPKYFSAIEIQNGRCTPRNNRRSRELAEKLQLGQTGGTDSHDLEEVGRSFTMFESNPASEDEVIEEIMKRRTTANGESRGIRGTMEYVYSSITKWIGRGMKKI
ncbi:MAG: PHP domain-containing protein [Thermoplasmata archaeon]